MKNAVRSANRLPLEIRTFFAVLATTTALSILFSFVALMMGLGRGYVTQLSSAAERFGDYPIYIDKFTYFHTAAFFTEGFPFTYPAPVSLVYLFFYRCFGLYGEQAFIAFCVLSFALCAIGFGRALIRRGVSTTIASAAALCLLLMSWPAVLVIDRGNMEIAVFVTLVLAFWAFAKGRAYTAAILIGIAASMKLFPFVFLALFFSRRQYRQLLTGAASFLAASLISLKILGPTIPIAYQGISDGLAFFKVTYMRRWHPTENGVDHSMFAFYKAGAIAVHGSANLDFLRPLTVYLALTAIAGLVLYFVVIRKLPIVNQILLLTIASIYFTPFSGDGTLLHLYTPFAMLCFVALSAHRRGIVVPALRSAMICLALLFAAENFILYKHAQHLEGEFKCVVLGFLFVLALRHPFGPPVMENLEGDRMSFEPPAAIL